DQFLRSLINPVEHAKQDYRNRIEKNLSLNAALTWNIIKDLNFRTEIATSYKTRNDKRYFGPLTGESRNTGGNLPLGQVTGSEGQSYRFTNTLNYKFKIGKNHAFNTLLGGETLSEFGNGNFRRAKYFDV